MIKNPTNFFGTVLVIYVSRTKIIYKQLKELKNDKNNKYN